MIQAVANKQFGVYACVMDPPGAVREITDLLVGTSSKTPYASMTRKNTKSFAMQEYTTVRDAATG